MAEQSSWIWAFHRREFLGLDTLYIPGTIEWTRATWLAAHPGDPLPPFDPTQDVRSYQSPTSPFLTLDFSNGGCAKRVVWPFMRPPVIR